MTSTSQGASGPQNAPLVVADSGGGSGASRWFSALPPDDNALTWYGAAQDAARPRSSSERRAELALRCQGGRFDDDARLPDDERRRLSRIRLHDLRHGHASLVLAAGVPIEIVSRRLGHSSLAITADTYSHF